MYSSPMRRALTFRSTLVLALILTACSSAISTEESSACVRGLQDTNCSGCTLVENPDAVCLVHNDWGEIVADFPASSDAILMARAKDGSTAHLDAPWGFDGVVPAWGADGRYYVFAANRENDTPKSFDTLFLVDLTGPASIKPLVTGGRVFGGVADDNRTLIYIPHADAIADLHATITDPFAEETDTYAFGKELAKDPSITKDMWLATGNIIPHDRRILIGFWKDGYTTSKDGPFIEYVVSVEDKTVFAVRPLSDKK